MSANENLVREQMELNGAKLEAARRETAGLLKTIKLVRLAMLPAILVPFVGAFWIGLMAFIAFWMGVYVAIKGNPSDGVKSIIFTVLTAFGSMMGWLIVNFVVIALFG